MKPKMLLTLSLLLASAVPANAETPAPDSYISRKSIGLAAAKRIAAAAEGEAIERQQKVSIAVVDEAGRLVHFQRMDGTSNSSVDVAIAKAVHAANYRRDTAFHHELLSKGNLVVLGLPDILPVEGGLMLKVGDEVIGGIGISGAPSDVDGKIALAGADILRAGD